MSRWRLQENCLGEIDRSDRCFGKRDIIIMFVNGWQKEGTMLICCVCSSPVAVMLCF